MTDMRRLIESMPKAELHVHVAGTLEPEPKDATQGGGHPVS